MKELSIEEKAKRYDEVLKVLHKEEQNTAWSEEDENRVNRLIAYFEDKESFTAEDDIVYANWLKSLKDRVQPKQEWSEEDEEIHRKCICAMRASACGFPEEEKFVEQVSNWLESIKDRVQLQNLTVTDEELALAKKDAYNDALDKIEYYNGEPTFDDGWNAAIWYLKKRNAQPQNRWKPSDEQMDVLVWCQPLFVDPKLKGILDSLISDLKKLREK